VLERTADCSGIGAVGDVPAPGELSGPRMTVARCRGGRQNCAGQNSKDVDVAEDGYRP
jgi:hypothetical protein